MKLKPAVYVLLAILVLAGLFFAFKPKDQAGNVQNQQLSNVSPAENTSQTPGPAIKIFELVITEKKLPPGAETIKITEGDEVVIKITSDEPEEFHLHGYDKFADLEKAVPAELKFTAGLTGRFVFELENSSTDLGVIEVSPR